MNLIGDKFDDMQKTNGFLRKIRTPIFLIALFLCLSFSIRSGFCEDPKDTKALANFREAGLSEYIDARLADAHELVEKLKGPFDFVFSDADKDWYKNYFIALAPKLEVGGCFTAHNARNTGMEGIREYIDYVKNLPNFKTTIDKTSRAGISISYKIAEK